jgi:hypothetical protein
VSTVAPQAVGGAGVVPFQAASHEVVFDAFTSDSWTPAAATVNLFNGSLGQVRPYAYLANLWVKVTTSGGVAGSGVLAADAPWNAIQTFRFLDPNGHAVIDCDGYGLYLLAKYGGRYWLGDPSKLPNANATGVVTWRYSYLVPFQINPELGIGALPNMDSSGPYRIQAVGNTQAAIYSTITGLTSPLVSVAVGGEFLSLPDATSRVTGAPQIQAPPGLDRGYAIVCEYTKQSYAIQSGGGVQTIRLTRVGNILRQLFLVVRNSSGARIDGAHDRLHDHVRIRHGAALAGRRAAHPRADGAPALRLDHARHRRARGRLRRADGARGGGARAGRRFRPNDSDGAELGARIHVLMGRGRRRRHARGLHAGHHDYVPDGAAVQLRVRRSAPGACSAVGPVVSGRGEGR